MKNLVNDISEFAQNTADKNGWSVQPDKDFLKIVLDGLVKTRVAFGYYLCPCRDGWGNRFKDRDITCPCEYAEEDIREFGHCYCGLFLSEEAFDLKRAPEAIPDRRPEVLYPD